jgi:aryl-alcohol dehydrogenase-like predicted oxidoreductase
VRELGIGFVAYSPLGRGFLAGRFASPDELEEGDFRKHHPRLQGENFEQNRALADHVRDLAAEKGCTPAQLALAWVLAMDPKCVPIPGTKRVKTLEENVAAMKGTVTREDLEALDAIAPKGAAAGERYPATMMGSVNR